MLTTSSSIETIEDLSPFEFICVFCLSDIRLDIYFLSEIYYFDIISTGRNLNKNKLMNP